MRALASSLLADAETRIIYRQESDQLGVTAQALGLTGTERKLLLPSWAPDKAVADQGILIRRATSTTSR